MEFYETFESRRKAHGRALRRSRSSYSGVENRQKSYRMPDVRGGGEGWVQEGR